MVTRRRERGLRERSRRDAVLLEKRAVQRQLDDQRPLRCFGELHDPIRIRRLRGRERQSTSKADEVVRVLRDVMLEARLAQRAGRELRVERHRADDLVNGGVFIPGLAREEFRSAHGRGCFLELNDELHDVSESWWRTQSGSNLSQHPNSLICGNLQGISAICREFGLATHGNRRYIMQLWPKFPAQRSREFS